jgi:hypothetical protein
VIEVQQGEGQRRAEAAVTLELLLQPDGEVYNEANMMPGFYERTSF